jgi:uncharacterized membrane protein YbhN (UPF0104 family)
MQVQEAQTAETVSIESYDNVGPSRSRRRFLIIQVVILLCGLALLGYLLYSLGFRTIFETISRIGWGFLLIVAINGSRHLARALCIYLAIEPEHRLVRFHNVLAARLAGEAVNLMTVTGPFLGDATKVALLKRRQSLAHSAAAVIVDDILYYVTVGLMILSGIGLLVLSVGNVDRAIGYALLVVVGLISLMLLGLAAALRFNVKPVSFLLKRLDQRGVLPKSIASMREHVFEIETKVFDVYFQRPGTFYSLLAIGLFTHALSVLEVFVAMLLLGSTPTVTNAYIIESLTKVVNFAFSFVPGTVGVYEGGNALFLNVLGYSAAVGVALALVRRGAILFWVGLGVAILIFRTVSRSRREYVNLRSQS